MLLCTTYKGKNKGKISVAIPLVLSSVTVHTTVWMIFTPMDFARKKAMTPQFP